MSDVSLHHPEWILTTFHLCIFRNSLNIVPLHRYLTVQGNQSCYFYCNLSYRRVFNKRCWFCSWVRFLGILATYIWPTDGGTFVIYLLMETHALEACWNVSALNHLAVKISPVVTKEEVRGTTQDMDLPIPHWSFHLFNLEMHKANHKTI